ncbi:MAG: hypothetical protein HT580_01030 [Dechloromonas sp.]|nr:MAG: hypothetical protein HT580_01030 [Dechloromonas sp.]
MANEELARQRGISLENQSRISQRVIERMQDGVLVIDSAGRVRRHNPMVETMLEQRRPTTRRCPNIPPTGSGPGRMVAGSG